jgi:hypothetical protein
VLEVAVERRGIDFIEFVLEDGTLPEMTEDFGSKLLFNALTTYKPNELDEDIVELLLEEGAKPMQEGNFGKEAILRKTRFDRGWLAEKIPSLFTD